jgi:hypothetical protein
VSQRTGQTAASPPRPSLRLTGRGAVATILVLSFLGLLAAGWLGWGVLSGGAFAAACVLTAARTRRTDLLTVAVSPPALFLVAVVCDKALVSPGNVLLSGTEGTLITLSDTAPWLIAGTALSLAIAFSRGLWENVRVLRQELRFHPATTAGRPGGTASPAHPPADSPATEADTGADADAVTGPRQ